MKALTYVEIDVDYCSLRYGATTGAGTCPAVLGVDSAIKCFNSISTCAVRDSFTNVPVTLRFALPADYLPADIEALPDIDSIAYSPATVSLGEDLGQRASLSVTFNDHPHSDTGPGGDPYLADRDYNPFKQGSFWGKFRARQPFLRGRPMRLIQGTLGQAIGEMESRLFLIESFEGPSLDGKFTITAKDALKLADGDRAQAPLLSAGALSSDITATDFQLSLAPSGVGTSYPATGYINIGGAEIAGFARDTSVGNDADTLLLLHGDGDDAATSITDASASARTVTVSGNLQLDTAWFKFGSAALLFDGTGDYATVPDSADWHFGTGDFTVDLWIKIGSLAAQRTVLSQQTDANNRMQLFVTTAGAIGFSVSASSATIITLTSSNGVILVNTEYHVALVRHGNDFAIYVDGVSVATSTDSDAVPDYTGALTIGMVSTTTNPYLGWMDELRLSKVARWTTGFTPPTVPYQASGDVLYLTRAQFNTEAAEHNAGDRAQLCLIYTAQDPADVIADLFQTYAGIDPGYISLGDWQAETAAFYRRLVSAIITEPTSVNTLLAELIQQCGLAIWWDDLGAKIRLQVLRAIATDAEAFDDSNVLEGSLKPEEQPDKRISEVWTYYGLRNPLNPLQPDNFRSVAILDDLDAEEDYGQPAIKTIFSRWIPFGGETIAQRLNQIQLGRYRVAPRHFSFQLPPRALDIVSPEVGEGCRLSGSPMQDATGARENVPIQITRLYPFDPKTGQSAVEAEEQLFVDLSDDDLTTDTIIISADAFNIDLRALHDGIYPAAESGDTVLCIINAGIIVGSASTLTPAFDVGSWAAGVAVKLVVNGRLEGHGGDGAKAGGTPPAEDGGTALYLRQAIDVEYGAAAQIWGGGGGGADIGKETRGGAGGGAGQRPGSGGTSSIPANNGAPGTTEAGGAVGGPGTTTSGAGGGPGLDGAPTTTSTPAPGGTAGSAIDGVSFVTVLSGVGDIRGATVN